MPGPWKEWKTKSRFPTLSTAPFKSRNNGEIFTFPPPRRGPPGKVENQPQVFHFPSSPRDDDNEFPSSNQTPRKEVGPYAASSFVTPLSLRSSGNPVS